MIFLFKAHKCTNGITRMIEGVCGEGVTLVVFFGQHLHVFPFPFFLFKVDQRYAKIKSKFTK